MGQKNSIQSDPKKLDNHETREEVWARSVNLTPMSKNISENTIFERFMTQRMLKLSENLGKQYEIKIDIPNKELWEGILRKPENQWNYDFEQAATRVERNIRIYLSEIIKGKAVMPGERIRILLNNKGELEVKLIN